MKNITITIAIALATLVATGQKTSVHDKPEADFKLALELFNKEKYGAAQKLFDEVIDEVDNPNSGILINSRYYKAVCALQLFNPDAEVLLSQFINKYPVHHKQSVASFYMGNLQYRNRNYEDALARYAKVDIHDLDKDQKEEFTFKRGHSYFNEDDYENAKRLLNNITNRESVYYVPATYYYGHIAYIEENYQTALNSFNDLIDDRSFGPIVPYYITHIYYLQGKYDKLLEYAPPLLEEASTRREAEIARLIGDAYFSKGKYEKAVTYLEDFRSKTRNIITNEDYYQLAYSYYNIDDCDNAITYFERITSADEDSLVQNAYYLLADCYLKTDENRAARNAFMAAHRMDYIPEIKQDALFNYAKLSYELAYSPYNEAIISFQKYIDTYPNSIRIDEAYEYLLDLFLTSKNYRDAMTSLEQIEINTPKLREAYQRIAYYRGVELFNNGDFNVAIDFFERSLKYPENNTIRAECLYWTAQAYYRKGRYDEAISYNERFLVTPGAFDLEEYDRANYNIGYGYFKKEQYEDAISSFRKFIRNQDQDSRLLNDAYLRIADSYFVTKEYRNAIDYYDRAIQKDIIDSDYALFQKSLAFGVIGDYNRKANMLQQFLRKYPNSNFIADAKYELANTYTSMDDTDQALNYFSLVVDDHPNSSYAKSAMLKKGLILYNTYEDEKAIEQFKAVVEGYPGTEQANEALKTMKSVYVTLDRVNEYVSYTEGLGLSDLTTAQQDSLTYTAAENRYMQGDCENAIRSFNNYIDGFPDGIFVLESYYYSAECHYRRNEYQQALTGYEYVADQPSNRFSENAALRAGSINYSLGNYSSALDYYIILERFAKYRKNILEARVGQMRCLFNIERYNKAVDAANSVIETDRVSQNYIQEAYIISANSLMKIDQLDEAREYFTKAADIINNEIAAEAMYNLALIEFRKGNYEKCEELIFDYVNHITAYEYWLAKMFILLADNYLQKENVFQAKHTLESIIENYDGKDLVSVANKKLEKIGRQEKEERTQEKDDESLEVDF